MCDHMAQRAEEQIEGGLWQERQMANKYYKGYDSLPASVKKKLSVYMLREIFEHMVKPMLEGKPEKKAEINSIEKHWCMCTELGLVARDMHSTCSKCGGKDAYGESVDRPENKRKVLDEGERRERI